MADDEVPLGAVGPEVAGAIERWWALVERRWALQGVLAEVDADLAVALGELDAAVERERRVRSGTSGA